MYGLDWTCQSTDLMAPAGACPAGHFGYAPWNTCLPNDLLTRGKDNRCGTGWFFFSPEKKCVYIYNDIGEECPEGEFWWASQCISNEHLTAEIRCPAGKFYFSGTNEC